MQDSASDRLDYTSQTNATAEISSGSTEIIYIPIVDDQIYEGTEEFSVVITEVSGAAYSSGIINTPIRVTITDNETEPTLTISAFTCDNGVPIPENFSINESAGNLIFNAKLSHPSKTPINFNYVTTADTATNFDFYASTTQYTIHSGSICTEIITPITHDILHELDEKFEVTFTSESGTNIIPSFKVNIEDDDTALWSIDDLTMNEGDNDSVMAFRVYLNTPVYKTVRAKWTASTITGNTATFDEDYAPDHNSFTGYVTIMEGQIEGYIDGLETTGDTIFEPDETFTVFLSDPEDGTKISDSFAIGTIINDDPIPTLTVSADASINEADGNLEITATLSNQTTDDITLRYSTANGTAVGGSRFHCTIQCITYNSGPCYLKHDQYTNH